MLRTIINQMWKQRGQNGWVFLELLFVGVFLWVVLDPLCVQQANKNIDRGYEMDGLYVLTLDKYGASSLKYNKSMDGDSVSKAMYLDMIRELRDVPEIECHAVVPGGMFVNSGAFSGGSLYADSALTKETRIQCYWTYPMEGCDILATYRLTDANTGKEMKMSPDFRSKYMIYISESVAMNLYGRKDVVGEKCYMWNKNANEIGGVYKDFKQREYEQGYPTFIGKIASSISGGEYMQWQYTVLLRLKDGVDADEFEKRFDREIKPRLKRGNYYCTGITPMRTMAQELSEMSGELNITRKNTIFAVFGIICVFLGMVGTFWVNVNARRQEIGVMRSIGASKDRIVAQFVAEGLVLVTTATIISTLIMANYVYSEGFFVSSDLPETLRDMTLWQNNALQHFAVVSMAVYVVMALTSVIGTLIPVSRAVNELPADALREE